MDELSQLTASTCLLRDEQLSRTVVQQRPGGVVAGDHRCLGEAVLPAGGVPVVEDRCDRVLFPFVNVERALLALQREVCVGVAVV